MVLQETLEPYIELGKLHLNDARLYVNAACKDLEAWQIIFFSISATIIVSALWEFLFQDESKFTKERTLW